MLRVLTRLTGETAGHRLSLGEVPGRYGTSEAARLCHQEKQGGDVYGNRLYGEQSG
jgi:hypothetical protein